MGKYSCYVVIRGRSPGIYATWEECRAQVDGYNNARYWGCFSEEEAIEALVSGVKATGSTESTLKRLKVEAYMSTNVPNSSSPETQSTVVTEIDDWKVIKHRLEILLLVLIYFFVVLTAATMKFIVK
ncbi:hypothetical protein OROGR_007385 [Orobanche gracilis]